MLLLLALVHLAPAFDQCEQQHGLRETLLCGRDAIQISNQLTSCSFTKNGSTTEYYRNRRTSRIDQTYGGFKLTEPLPRDALYNISCCPDAYHGCHQTDHYRIVVPFKSIPISRVQPFFFRHKLVSLLVSTAHLPSSYEGLIELVVDVDPLSCSSKYFKKLSFTITTSSGSNINTFTNMAFFSFSDPDMPSTCNFSVYLQHPCSEHYQCNDFNQSDFTVSVNDTAIRGTIDALTNLNELRQLEVMSVDSFNYFINSKTRRTFIQQNAHSIKIFAITDTYGTTAIGCEAHGYPPPAIRLGNSEGRRFGPSKCISCGDNCTSCQWSIKSGRRFCEYHRDIVCSAKIAGQGSKTIRSLPFQFAEFGPMSAVPSVTSVSIYGSAEHNDGVARIRVQIPLPSWHLQRKCYVERNGRNEYRWNMTELNEFKRTILNALTWEKDGFNVNNFACNRRAHNVTLSEKCKTDDNCQIDIELSIFNPAEEDAGYYRAIFKGLMKSDMTSPRVKLNVNTERTKFYEEMNTTKPDSSKYSKLEIKRCRALDGRQVRCEWHPIYNQLNRTDLYSIQFIRQDYCAPVPNLDDFMLHLTNEATISSNGMHDDIEFEYVGSDLTPSADYKIVICAWNCQIGYCKKPQKRGAELSDSPPSITGAGPRICRETRLKTPPDVPIELAINEGDLHYEPQLLETNYDLNQRPGQFVADFVQEIDTIRQLMPNINGFDAILTLRNRQDRYTFEPRTEPIKFMASSYGRNLVKMADLPPGCRFEADFRFVNDYGLGPVRADIDPTKEERRIRQNITTPRDVDMMIDRVSTTSDTVQVCFKSFQNARYDNDYDLSGIVIRDFDDNQLHYQITSRNCLSFKPATSVSVFSSNNFKLGTILSELPDEDLDLPSPFIYSAHRTKGDLKLYYASRLFLLDGTLKMSLSITRYPIRYDGNPMKIIESKVLLKTVRNSETISGDFVFDFGDDCRLYPEHCNKEVRFVLSYEDIKAEKSLTLVATSQNVISWSDQVIQAQLRKPILEISTDMRTMFQTSFAVVHVIQPRVATGYEYGLQYEVADPLGHSCSEMDKYGDNMDKRSYTMLLPRANYESLWNDIEMNVNYNLDFIKAHTYGYNDDRWDQSLREENKIRLSGGMNGLNLSTVDVYNKMQVKYLRGGLIKLPMEKCYLCWRYRIVYRSPNIEEDGCNRSGLDTSLDTDCKGEWSRGEPYIHRLQSDCIWNGMPPISPHISESTDQPEIVNTTTMLLSESSASMMGASLTNPTLSGLIIVLILLIIIMFLFIRFRHRCCVTHQQEDPNKPISRAESSLSNRHSGYIESDPLNQALINVSNHPNEYPFSEEGGETDSGCASMPDFSFDSAIYEASRCLTHHSHGAALTEGD